MDSVNEVGVDGAVGFESVFGSDFCLDGICCVVELVSTLGEASGGLEAHLRGVFGKLHYLVEIHRAVYRRRLLECLEGGELLRCSLGGEFCRLLLNLCRLTRNYLQVVRLFLDCNSENCRLLSLGAVFFSLVELGKLLVVEHVVIIRLLAEPEPVVVGRNPLRQLYIVDI